MERRKKPAPQHLKKDPGHRTRPARAGKSRARSQETVSRDTTPAEPSRAVSPQISRSTILFEETLLPTVENVHRIDRKGLRVGLAWLAILPVLLLVVRRLTDSSKVAFLIIWIIGMFIISAALIFIAYTDHELMRFLRAVKERVPAAEDVELDSLVHKPELELPVSPERLRGILLRRRGHSAAEASGQRDEQEAADLRRVEEWLLRLEQRKEKREHDAQHTQDHKD